MCVFVCIVCDQVGSLTQPNLRAIVQLCCQISQERSNRSFQTYHFSLIFCMKKISKTYTGTKKSSLQYIFLIFPHSCSHVIMSLFQYWQPISHCWCPFLLFGYVGVSGNIISTICSLCNIGLVFISSHAMKIQQTLTLLSIALTGRRTAFLFLWETGNLVPLKSLSSQIKDQKEFCHWGFSLIWFISLTWLGHSGIFI